MRFRLGLALAAAFASMWASPALADEEPEAPPPAPPAPVEAPAPAPTAAEAPAPAPAPANEAGPRDHGVRLGLDLSYARATSSDSFDSFANGSPSQLPIGVDLSFRNGTKTLLGLHAHVGLASRDDCRGTGSCSARTYGGGGHIEALFREGTGFVPWFRYGFGMEVLHQSGGTAVPNGPGVTRWGIDFADMRLGGDFVLSRNAEGKTWRLGPFVGADLGIVSSEDRGSNTGAGAPAGTAFVFLSIGVRGTLEP